MLCNDMGLSMTAAFTIFAKTVTREKRIPFEVSADPFYSESNLKHLQRVAAELNAGKKRSKSCSENWKSCRMVTRLFWREVFRHR